MEYQKSQNKLEVFLKKGTTIHFESDFMRTPGFSKDLLPKITSAFLCRLLNGRLWDPYLEAQKEHECITFSGPSPIGNFHFVEIPKGQSFFVKYWKFNSIAAYIFHEGGRFKRVFKPFKLRNLISGTAFGVRIEGPAEVAFYGEGIDMKVLNENERLFSDQVISFDASKTYTFKSLMPSNNSIFAQSINALSTTLSMEFADSTKTIYETVRKEKISSLSNIPKLVLSLLIFDLVIEKCVLWLLSIF